VSNLSDLKNREYLIYLTLEGLNHKSFKMASSLLIICATLVLVFIFTYFKKKYDYFKDRGIPNPTPYWPLGNFWKVGLSVHFIQRVNEIYNRFKNSGKICGFYVFTTPVYVVTDIDLIKNILVKDFDSFHDRGKGKCCLISDCILFFLSFGKFYAITF